jgi:hypothetical protein
MDENRARFLGLLRQQLKDWQAIIDGIERKSARYYVDRGAGRVETTQQTLNDYKKRIVDTEALIKELREAKSSSTDKRPEAPSLGART